MTFPSVQTTSQGFSSAATTDHTVVLPSGTVAGETLLVLFGHKEVITGANFPAGWTKFFEAVQSGGSQAVLAGAWKKADGSEGGASINVTTFSTVRYAYGCYRISGASDPTVTPPEAATAIRLNSANPDPPNLIPSGGAKDYLWIAAFCSSHGRITSTLPTNYTDNVGDGPNNAVVTNVGVGSGRRELNAASEDPGTFTDTGTGVEESASATIAVYPASAPGAGNVLSVFSLEMENALFGGQVVR